MEAFAGVVQERVCASAVHREGGPSAREVSRGEDRGRLGDVLVVGGVLGGDVEGDVLGARVLRGVARRRRRERARVLVRHAGADVGRVVDDDAKRSAALGGPAQGEHAGGGEGVKASHGKQIGGMELRRRGHRGDAHVAIDAHLRVEETGRGAGGARREGRSHATNRALLHDRQRRGRDGRAGRVAAVRASALLASCHRARARGELSRVPRERADLKSCVISAKRTKSGFGSVM